MVEIEAPALSLLSGMLANETIEPALDASAQVEIGAVNGENQRRVDDARVEPIAKDDLQPARPSAHSFHSLIHEKRCSRLSVACLIEVAMLVDCKRSSAALSRR